MVVTPGMRTLALRAIFAGLCIGYGVEGLFRALRDHHPSDLVLPVMTILGSLVIMGFAIYDVTRIDSLEQTNMLLKFRAQSSENMLAQLMLDRQPDRAREELQ